MTHKEIKDLQVQAIVDHRKGLLTKEQLLNIIHLLDRKSFHHGIND